MSIKQSQKKRKSCDDDRIIGQNLKRLRNLRGMSQQDLGDVIGITFQQIQKYENGTNRIAASTLLHISKALNFDFRLFYGTLIEEYQDQSLDTIDPKVLKLFKIIDTVDDPKILKHIESIVRRMIELDHKTNVDPI